MTEWSMMRHDLKTAIDILELPNYIKTSAYVRRDESSPLRNLDRLELNADSVIRLERRLNVCYVRACVLKLDDADWFALKKGSDFVHDHAHHVGSEILLPLECRIKVRMLDRNGGKLYRTVREIAADFPRFVRAEQDTVAATLGNSGHHVVSRGSVLELDRVTKSCRALRGFREDYLICRELEKSTEIAFTLFTPVLFRKAADRTKYLLKDFVEHLPLPQCVECLDSNPYDVVCESDDEARDLLTMLNGPLELRAIQVVEYVVGFVLERKSIIAIPLIDSFLEAALVYIPLHSSVPATQTDVESPVDYETMLEKLYLLYADNQLPVLLKGQPEGAFSYEEEDDLSIYHAMSAPEIDVESGSQSASEGRRRRIQSTGEMDRKNPKQRTGLESRGLKSYISVLSRRMKSTASQLLFGEEIHRHDSNLSRNSCSRSQPDLTQRLSSRASDLEPRSGFICYLDTSLKTDDMKISSNSDHSFLNTESERKGIHFDETDKISSQTLNFINADKLIEANLTSGFCDVTYADISGPNNNNQLCHLNYSTADSLKDELNENYKKTDQYSSCTNSRNNDNKTDVVYAKVDKGRARNASRALYASVDMSKKTRNFKPHNCDICRHNLT
ncbi:uncharacterized protein LOC127862080 isoform X2 [Dreissena polymorpha]|uniref:uncharacterized protein LOC127862080 isoform X2 n=1 Tax=Dreissena polymorpha TaxID=45954 RepID=UPI00226541E5|nr:uncharacterized protein LOC127862080 isoform X2 [Dreissena polymorpha]